MTLIEILKHVVVALTAPDAAPDVSITIERGDAAPTNGLHSAWQYRFTLSGERRASSLFWVDGVHRGWLGEQWSNWSPSKGWLGNVAFDLVDLFATDWRFADDQP